MARARRFSHIGIDPDQRDAGIGFALKRAQWQMVRHQGLDHITWTYDPLLSRNAYLNIAKLGAVCNTYRRSEYGDMRDGNALSDRFLRTSESPPRRQKTQQTFPVR
jgi:predicted GNAT superfamily acetyltransferase